MRDELFNLLQAGNLDAAKALLSQSAPEDIAHALRDLRPEERMRALQLLDHQTAIAVFELLPAEPRNGVSVAARPTAEVEPGMVNLLLAERQFQTLRRLLTGMGPVDTARLLEQLPPEAKVLAFRLLPKGVAVEVFEHMSVVQQQALLHGFTDDRARDIIAAMSPDDRTRLLDEAPAMVAHRLLQLLPPRERQTAVALLGYPEKSAGRVMTPDFVALRQSMTVGQAIDRIRRQALDKETIYYSYVMDATRRLLGTVSLKDLMLAQPDTVIGEIMKPAPRSVPTHMSQEEVARVLADYDLLAVPVVDAEGRLVGIVTWDDAIDIVEAEATEDIHRMAGLGVKERVSTPLLESARRRIPWLAFNMAWALGGAGIINIFEGSIERVAALAIFMPIIAGQAGNAGIQTATIVVRSMGLGELQSVSLRHLLLKEWGVGLLKGGLFGTVLFLVAYILKGNMALAEIAGAALFLNIMVATTAGVLVPLTLLRMGVDPATVAGVFDTMLSDFMGFLIYLGLATLFISAIVR